MIDSVSMLQGRWSKLYSILTTKVFVDDLTLAVTGSPVYVIRVLAEVIDFAVDVL